MEKGIGNKKLYNYLKGTRGSKKSKTIALRYIYNLLNNSTAFYKVHVDDFNKKI
ncbi:MAG: hypothetical protein RR523_12535 [Cetobacterium sp.]